MQVKRLTFWAAVLLLVVLIVAACAPRAGGGSTLELAGAEGLAVDLPAMVIDFDSNGQPSVANVPLSQLGDQVAPGMLESLAMPADAVQFMSDSNIQHLQISNSPEGVILLVNGKPLPSLKWDGEALQNTAQTIELVGVDLGPAAAVLDKLLPLVTRLGIGMILRFPVTEDVAEIPVFDAQAYDARTATKQAQQAFLAAVDSPPTIAIPIYYDAQGSWRVGDLTDAEWINLTGLPVFDSIRLRPEAVEQLMRQGISDLTLATDVDGIHVSINGKSLPYVGWADGELSNALALAEQMGLWNTLAEQNMDVDEIVAMVETLLPVVQATEITVTAHFPEALASTQ